MVHPSLSLSLSLCLSRCLPRRAPETSSRGWSRESLRALFDTSASHASVNRNPNFSLLSPPLSGLLYHDAVVVAQRFIPVGTPTSEGTYLFASCLVSRRSLLFRLPQQIPHTHIHSLTCHLSWTPCVREPSLLSMAHKTSASCPPGKRQKSHSSQSKTLKRVFSLAPFNFFGVSRLVVVDWCRRSFQFLPRRFSLFFGGGTTGCSADDVHCHCRPLSAPVHGLR